MDNVTIPHAPADQPEPLELKDNRMWLACPAYGSKIDLGFMTSVMSCFSQLQCVGDLQFGGGDSLVCRARNNLVQMFLKGRVMQVHHVVDGKPMFDKAGAPVVVERMVKFDWLMFIDTDLIFQPYELQMLYDLAMSKGPGVYAGTYPLKTIRPKIVFNPRPGSSADENGVVSVHEAGTGFMLIHRKVFERMQKAYPQNDFVSDNGDGAFPGGTPKHDWFQVGVYHQENKPSRYLSEDWFFCRKWIDMGGDIFMQTKICANHIGMITYPIDPHEILAVADVYQKTLDAKKAKRAALTEEEKERMVA